MFLKWLFDKLASLFGLLFLSPVLLVVAILIKVKMPGPYIVLSEESGACMANCLLYISSDR